MVLITTPKRTKKINKCMKHIHHIIPKHAGGTDDPNNLIELTPEEHAEAHRILYEKYGRIQDKVAWLGLAKLATNKEIIAELLKQPKSEEHKKKISKAHKGMNKPWLVGSKVTGAKKGVAKTKEHRENISKGKKGKTVPALLGNTNAASLKGKPKSKAHIDAVRKSINTTEVKEKISNSWAAKPIVTCPHCGKQGKEGHNMNRYHFDNCRGKNGS
jgi:hypothetical protein